MSSDIVAQNSIWTQQSILTEEALFLDQRSHSFLSSLSFMHVNLTNTLSLTGGIVTYLSLLRYRVQAQLKSSDQTEEPVCSFICQTAKAEFVSLLCVSTE